MIKIHDAVEQLLLQDEEAVSALSNGYMNLSQYAQNIHKGVESLTMKEVGIPSIVVSLSRLAQELDYVHPLTVDVKIKTLTTKSPLVELTYMKSADTVKQLLKVYAKVKSREDFFTMTLSTSEITVICSEQLLKDVAEAIDEKPLMTTRGLASIGLSLDPKYYPLPNITFSLIRKIALKRIPLAETITTRTEIIFVFPLKHLAAMVETFSNH